MTSSDFLVFITIILAIISTAIANNKMIWIYKFSRIFLIFYFAIIFIINYFIFFPWYEQKGIYIKKLMIEGGPQAATWGYILTLIFIFLLTWKIAISKHFPSSNHAQLINYYKSLINSNINVLIEYLQTYHSPMIAKFITKTNKSYQKRKSTSIEECPWQDYDEQSPKENSPIEAIVFSELILNKAFIIKSIESSPTFFLESVHRCINADIVGFKDAVEVYFRTMIRQKNPQLVEDLKNTVNYKENQTTEYRLDDSPLLTLLFAKTEFVYNLEVFRAFGEEALRESSLRNALFSEQTNEWKDDKYQSTAIFQFLRFTDIFIRKLLAFIKNNKQLYEEPFLYIYYFKMICSNLIQNHTTRYVGSYTQKYVEDLICNISNWLKVMVNLRVNTFEYEMLNVHAQLADEMIKISTLKNYGIEIASTLLSNFFVIEQKESICTSKLSENEPTLLITNTYIDFIQKTTKNKEDMYIKAWEKVDKIKYHNSSYIETLSKLFTKDSL